MDFFGLSFENILLVLMVSLIIFGPERLPEMATKAGRFINNIRRMSTETRQELSQEFGLSELNKLKSEMTEIAKETRQELTTLKTEVTELATDTKKGIDDIKSEVKHDLTFDQSIFSVTDNNITATEESDKTAVIQSLVAEDTVALPVATIAEPAKTEETVSFNALAVAVTHAQPVSNGNYAYAASTSSSPSYSSGSANGYATSSRTVNWKAVLTGSTPRPVVVATETKGHKPDVTQSWSESYNPDGYFGKRAFNGSNGANHQPETEAIPVTNGIKPNLKPRIAKRTAAGRNRP